MRYLALILLLVFVLILPSCATLAHPPANTIGDASALTTTAAAAPASTGLNTLLDVATDPFGALAKHLNTPGFAASIDSAVKITQSDNDIVAGRCFSWLQAAAAKGAGDQRVQAVGLIGEWAALRRTRLELQQSTTIRDFELNCAPLIMDEKMTLAQFVMRLGSLGALTTP